MNEKEYYMKTKRIFALLLAAIILSNTYCGGIIYSLIKG